MSLHLRRKTIIALVLIILGVVIGPFGTYVELGLWQRVVYWTVAVAGVGFFMSLAFYLALTHPDLDRYGWYPRLITAAIVAGLPSSVVIVILEGMFRDIVPTIDLGGSVWMFVTLVGLSVGLVEYRRSEMEPTPHHEPPRSAASPSVPMVDAPVPGAAFFSRLNPRIGRSLVSVSVNDHYLDVVTREGRETLLMRMADAERELADYPGMRIHRSHWVALDAVEGLQRDGNRWTVRLAGGGALPASREFGPRLRDALRPAHDPVETPAPAGPTIA